ncbi:MAG: hydroxyacylglutathione hydrolase [Alphaproteobacteria bacterium CG_4_9_14_3_um_filter_47_13]|nr:MAG: hydroxyacylglutathione hydrolase [Alphaproteobacteria bacterium CG_4_9_14_3_um_filter_47_13]
MEITLIPLLKDNYAYLLVDEDGSVAILDPSEAAPVKHLLEDKELKPDTIINTHHHWDHTGGNQALKKAYGCRIAAPAADSCRIEDLDIPLKEGDLLKIGTSTAQILETPGHTSDHICLYFPQEKALFCGDTLFAMGCGRLFEGTAGQMWKSLNKIMALPDDTLIYCGHEYTQANGEFCLTIEPDNTALKERMISVYQTRAENKATIPSILGLEKQTNVFLRAGSVQRFAEIRHLKDQSR